ncbi:DUF3306 domain-containing protein [Roseicyclus marinus]|uniref:DUF3306 domain-containing protein n=1 Tax=Roseicyclus marinus TaxID=2161673 RepID=UPI00240F90EF|nr:DUF3306 domain-containing protein [Roseicyclus marinus]MDG3041261.1 DUF3306 domain-containing protein [Roseicyclus marinus]
MNGDEPEGFLGRWSRVKRTAVRSEPETESELPPEADAVAEGTAAPEVETEAAPPTLSDEELAALPRIEDLVQGSDIRPFLRPGVPRSLKNAALRRIWMLTPGIRDHQDPAVDYAWDWNTPGGVPGDGVAPSPERAAQMLKSLLSPRGDTAAEAVGDQSAEAAAAEAIESDDATEASAADDGPKPAVSAAVSEATPAARTTDDSVRTSSNPVDDPDALPRRRHGSAMPG